MSPPRAALALLLALGPLAAGGGDVSTHLTLHGRLTAAENRPGTAVLYDVASRTFALDGYLVPSGDERYGSFFASMSLDGSAMGGDLRWRLALDTGEVRRRAYPRIALVCPTPLSGTGLGPGPCVRPLLLEETREDPPVLASNGRPLGEELEATLLVREAYAALSFGRAGFTTVRAGRKRVSVADGFVYDDYASGVELALDLGAVGPPLALTAALFQPTRDAPATVAGISPFFALRADWLPSLFEHAGVFVALHRDRTGSVAELFRGAIVERTVALLDQETDPARSRAIAGFLAEVLSRPLDSDATMAWLGTSGSLAPWRGQRLGWTAALLGGRIDGVRPEGAAGPFAERVTLRGRLLSVRWETSLGERLGIGAFFLHLSGGSFPFARPDEPATGQYGGFLGIAPYVTATNLFFGGGLSESFAARQATAPGVNGRGVTAPGVTLALDPTPALGLELKAAYLTSPVTGPFGGSVYGAEVDAVLTWAPRDWLLLGVELDALWPGDFFAGRDTLYKTVLAVDLLSP